jgi:hypothetical protein
MNHDDFGTQDPIRILVPDHFPSGALYRGVLRAALRRVRPGSLREQRHQ